MRIAIFSSSPLGEITTGSEARMNFLVDSLSNRGVEVHVFARRAAPELSICKGAIFHKSPWLAKAMLRHDALTLRSFARASAVCTRNLKYLVRDYGFDIIQAEEMRLTIPSYLASKLEGLPLILDEPDVEFNKAIQWKGYGDWRRIYLIEKFSCHRARRVLTSSEGEKQVMKHSFGLPENRISVIPNGVDTAWFSPSCDMENRSKLGISNRPVVLLMGNYLYYPNADAMSLVLKELLPRVKRIIGDVVFLAIGKGLNSLGVPSDYNFKPLGFVNDPRGSIGIADVCIAPIRYGGGTRTKILEYMSMGKAVVSTSKGCEGLDVKRGEDILIEDDYDQFAMAIVSLLKNDSLRAAMGRRARETAVGSYAWSNIASQLISVYQEILDDK